MQSAHDQQCAIQRAIGRLLDLHALEWYQEEDGTIVTVTHLSQYVQDPNDPLHGTAQWTVELAPVHTVREAMLILGY